MPPAANRGAYDGPSPLPVPSARTLTNSILSNSSGGGADVVSNAPANVAGGAPNTVPSTVNATAFNIVGTTAVGTGRLNSPNAKPNLTLNGGGSYGANTVSSGITFLANNTVSVASACVPQPPQPQPVPG